MFPEEPDALLHEGVHACFERGERSVDLRLVGVEEGLEVGDVEIGGAAGLREGEVEEEYGLEEVVQWDPDNQGAKGN